MVLLPIPGAPSTATGSGGTPSHAATTAATSPSRPTTSGLAASPAAPRPGGDHAAGARVSLSACNTSSSSCSGLENRPAITPDSSTRARNARCRACNPGSPSSNRPGGTGTAASSSSKNTSRGSPASDAVSNSSSV